MPTVSSITIRRLNKDTIVTQTLGKDFSTDVIETDSSSDMSSSLFNDWVPIDVWQETQTKPLRGRRVSESIDSQRRLWRMKYLSYSIVKFVVRDWAPKGRLCVCNRLYIPWSCDRSKCHRCQAWVVVGGACVATWVVGCCVHGICLISILTHVSCLRWFYWHINWR